MYGLGSDFVNWLGLVLSGVISSGAVVGLIYYVGKETYKDILNRKLETFKSDLNRDMERFKYDLSEALEKHKQELGIEATRRQLTLQSQIEFKERQLSEFYGPVYSLLKRIRPIDDLRNDRRLEDIETVALQIIRESNDKIVEIILTKGHLIQGERIPESYTGFLSHVPVWHAFLDLPSDKWEVFHNIEEAQYQPQFEEEVFLTTETLKRELYSLYEQYGLSPIKIGATDLNRERHLPVQSEAPAVVRKS